MSKATTSKYVLPRADDTPEFPPAGHWKTSSDNEFLVRCPGCGKLGKVARGAFRKIKSTTEDSEWLAPADSSLSRRKMGCVADFCNFEGRLLLHDTR